MKLFFWILGPLLILCGLAARVLWLRLREKRAQQNGIAVYATVISLEMATFLGKPSPAMKIKMWLQEPGETARREVTISSRIAPGQNITAGAMLPIVIDPSNPNRVYPAGPDAMKRIQYTGSRMQRRQLKKHANS